MEYSWKKNISKTFIFRIITFFIIICLILFFRHKTTTYPNFVGITINNQDYYLEVAQNPTQRSKGLSGRKNLCSNCGMLFIFNKEGVYPFWMKETYVPLDIIWLNSDYKIVKIATVLDVNTTTKIYKNKQLAKYVIELNANEAFKLDLKIGDTIQFPNLNE